MAIEIKEKKVLSSDKEHMLAGIVYIPDGTTKGLIQICHGMVEHMGRYDRFMRDMAEDGYIVFGCDQLGHGRTVRDESELGFIAHRDGWKRLVDDVTVFGDAVREEYGRDLKYTLLGHSMGSFIARLAAQRDMYDKLILSGTAGPNPLSRAAIAILRAEKAVKGERCVSPASEKIAFGKYNKRFDEGDPHSWLTKDTEVRRKYSKDPFCSFHFTLSALEDLAHLQHECNAKEWAGSLNRTKPVLLISGTGDPVGDYGKGVRKVFDMLSDAGVPVKMRLYENCRHEVLNEDCYDEAVGDIRRFISE
jgi:alpha-beta hydrolase superfamily lysophospholipase